GGHRGHGGGRLRLCGRLQAIADRGCSETTEAGGNGEGGERLEGGVAHRSDCREGERELDVKVASAPHRIKSGRNGSATAFLQPLGRGGARRATQEKIVVKPVDTPHKAGVASPSVSTTCCGE